MQYCPNCGFLLSQDEKIRIFEQNQSSEYLWDIIGETVTEREYIVLKLCFQENMKMSQVGIELGLTNERVRQIKNKALQKLREFFGSIRMRLLLGKHLNFSDL